MEVLDHLWLPSEPFTAILARVAYQLIVIDFANYPQHYFDPVAGLGQLSRRLYREGWSVLSVWVCAYAFHLGQGMSTASYRHCLIERARQADANRRFKRPWSKVRYG